MKLEISITINIYFIILSLSTTSLAFDHEDDFHSDHNHDGQAHSISNGETSASNGKPMPKDKILLKDIKTLTFYRNKRTTSKRTHSIHQLSCVGGTAGCKLFTPDVVECENIWSNGNRNWRCHADMSDRVVFNHVEVICEGYDYPEDDYILLGSCGLEFTLDYTDPLDYHHKSYFKHMDEHEKEMHQERIRSKANAIEPEPNPLAYLLNQLFSNLVLVIGMVLFGLFLFVTVRYLIPSGKTNSDRFSKKKPSRLSSYGPLTSAVMTTKKAC